MSMKPSQGAVLNAAATTTTTTDEKGKHSNPVVYYAPPPPSTNPLVNAMLTDLYQITMAYAYWKAGRHNEPAVFELFFRENPFGGEFTIFAGLDECIKYITHFQFTDSDVDYLRTSVPALSRCDPQFFDWLSRSANTAQVTVHALREGTICFPRVPLIIIEAPLAIGQLLETTLLTLVNYPSLVATNAARMVLAAHGKNVSSDTSSGTIPTTIQSRTTMRKSTKREYGNDELKQNTNDTTTQPSLLPAQCLKRPVCVEFGLRRAQGPDGGFSASKYAAWGGFVGTSNVLAGKLLGLSISGTHAHAFVQSYSSLEEVAVSASNIGNKNEDGLDDILPRVLRYREQLSTTHSTQYGRTNDGELAAFIAYARAFPHAFLCLIDTYDTLQSGLLNFILVALVLDDLGYRPLGVRLDSGDLVHLSMVCAQTFAMFADERPFTKELEIVASNDINEGTLLRMNRQRHAITVYGIGTHLVTCQAQPALGCVYKLVEISGHPKIKVSQDIVKVLIPGRKRAYRLWSRDQYPILDIMVGVDEGQDAVPVVGQRIHCRHPFTAQKRAMVTPVRVEALHATVIENGRCLQQETARNLEDIQKWVQQQLDSFSKSTLDLQHPKRYKVSVSEAVFDFMHKLWQDQMPVAEIY